MNLIETLTQQTQDLRTAYIAKTKEWAKVEFVRLREFAADYRANYHVSKEKAYYALPYCVHNNKAEEFVSLQLAKAEKHYTASIEKLAARIEKKGLNLDSLEMETSYLDPNLSTVITDGSKTVRAFTIIAGGAVQKPHYRYLIK